MIVLDTNVISELTRQTPNDRVLVWVDGQDEMAVATTTVAELLYGVARLPVGARKSKLADAIRELTEVRLKDNVIAFDRTAASHYAEIVAGRDRIGRPMAVADGQIAAICRARGAALATRNVRDFEETGITVINPWSA
jgi:predicted nucleic acid-binding protein